MADFTLIEDSRFLMLASPFIAARMGLARFAITMRTKLKFSAAPALPIAHDPNLRSNLRGTMKDGRFYENELS